MTFADISTMRSSTARCAARRLGQHRVQRRHHRHGQTRQQVEDVAARLTAEDAEFVLQADDVEPAGVQEVRGAHIVFELSSWICRPTSGGIVVGLTVIGHRHDGGVEIWPRTPRSPAAGRS